LGSAIIIDNEEEKDQYDSLKSESMQVYIKAFNLESFVDHTLESV
jgi:hypothetical protein